MAQDILYGVEASYYAAKIRAYLMCKGIDFREVLADRHAFETAIMPRVGWPVVPVIVTAQGETLQDTAVMIDHYEHRSATPVLVPHGALRCFVAYLFEILADEWLKMPALHYRWAYDHDYAVEMMGRNNDPDLPVEEQRRIGAKVAARFKGWPEILGVSTANTAAVEASYREFLDLFECHLAHHDFVLGEQPTLADCAMAGPLYAHLYLDPTAGALMRDYAPRVGQWAIRMRQANAVESTHTDKENEISETIVVVLKHLAKDYAAVLGTAMPLLQAWLGNTPDGDIPRYVGKHQFEIGAGKSYQARGLRAISTFEGWKTQRLMDRYQSFSAADRETVRRFCEGIGFDDFFGLNFPNRLTIKNFELVREDTSGYL